MTSPHKSILARDKTTAQTASLLLTELFSSDTIPETITLTQPNCTRFQVQVRKMPDVHKLADTINNKEGAEHFSRSTLVVAFQLLQTSVDNYIPFI